MQTPLRRLAGATLVVAALVLCAIPTPAAAPDKLLPSDSEMVVSINVKQMLGSQLFKKYGEEQVKAAIANDPRVKQSMEALGLDPLKDVDTVTISNSGAPTGDKMLVVIRGRYNLQKISQTAVLIAAKEPNFKISKQGSMEIYEGSAEGKPMFGTFVSNEALAISPSKDYLIASIKNGGVKGVSAPLQAAIKSLDGGKSIGMAALVTDDMRRELARNPQTQQFAPKLKALTSTINLTDAAQAVVNVHMTDAQSARQVSMLFTQIIPLLKVLAQGNEQFGPFLNDLLGTLKIGAANTTVSISLTVSEDMLLKAIQMGKN